MKIPLFFNFTMPEFKLWEQKRERQRAKREWARMEESIANERTLAKLRKR